MYHYLLLYESDSWISDSCFLSINFVHCEDIVAYDVNINTNQISIDVILIDI